MELAPEAFSLRTEIERLLDTLQASAREKDLGLRAELAGDLPEQVEGDHVKLIQVLTNLIGNAIKFTQEGEVVLRVQLLEQRADAATLRFAISDTGIGISAEHLGHIFDEFSQASTDVGVTYGGTGLGLAISRRLVALFGGELKAQSKLGAGSTFEFSLSLPLAAPDADAGLDESRQEALLAGADILLVDDNEINLEIVSELLRRKQAKVQCARDGAQAIRLLQKRPYDAILMDLRMPGMDGFAALEALRSGAAGAAGQAPVIAISASVRLGESSKLRNAGFDACLEKPIVPEKLYRTLATLLQAADDGS